MIQKILKLFSMILICYVVYHYADAEKLHSFIRITYYVKKEPYITYYTYMYYLILALSLISIAVTSLMKTNAIRYLFLILIGFSTLVELTLMNITGHSPEIQTYEMLLEARVYAGEAFQTYAGTFAKALAFAVVFIIAFTISPPRKIALRNRWAFFPVSAIIATSSVLWQYGDGFAYIAAPFSALPKIALAIESADIYYGPRDILEETPVKPGAFEKIVLIVDESVRGDYLQINNPNMDNTPLLAAQSHEFANFGLAVSYANCSAPSRLALRAGTHEEDLPDINQMSMHQPTFWQYAHKAGYKTVYLDVFKQMQGFQAQPILHHYQSFAEINDVDHLKGVDLSDYAEADNKVAEQLKEILKQPGKAFIYVEKLGTHAVYSQNYPSKMSYEPRRFVKSLTNLPENQAEEIKHYIRATWWRVDEFFRRVLPVLQVPNVLTIYTSDHGQSMFDGDYPGTHCTTGDAVKGEGLVPLLVFTGDEATKDAFRQAATNYYNKATHADIPGTLYSLMGYDPSTFRRPYKNTLLSMTKNRSRRFFGGSFYSADLHWNNVD